MIYGREKAKVPVTVINTPIMPKVGKEDDGKWHYMENTLADWIRENDKRTEQQILKEITDWAKEHNISTVYLIDEEFAKIGDYEVLRNTVGQWAGLCDIHDCPIFEDDIVVYAFADVPDAERGAVVFEDGEYKLKYFSGYMDDDLDGSMAKRQIVIGNIHDDPEMCEVEQ